VFDYIQFSKFHTQNGDDTLPRPTLIVRFSHNLNIISPVGRKSINLLLFNELKVQSVANICDFIALHV